MTRSQLSAIVVLALASFVARIWFSGEPISIEWYGYISTATGVAALAIAVFNSWVWRINLLQGWFVKRPHLWGIWNVTIKTEWIDPATGMQREPVQAALTIKQTYTSLRVRMTSAQSSGRVLCANLLRNDDGSFRLAGTYLNEPSLSERARSSMHYGSFLLDIVGPANAPTSMTGHYWTDRNTKGEMSATKRKK